MVNGVGNIPGVGILGAVATPPPRRREEYSEASRRALLDSARSRFETLGFTATSLDQVAADARLTKGAVYHHFASKKALFEAVLDEVEDETMAMIAAAAAGKPSARESGLAGLDAFLERCLDPGYQRICFQEGPVALGFLEWWAKGAQREMSLVDGLVRALADEGRIDTDHLDTLTELLFGSLFAGAFSIARSKNPVATRDAVRQVVVRLIEGMHPAVTPWLAETVAGEEPGR